MQNLCHFFPPIFPFLKSHQSFPFMTNNISNSTPNVDVHDNEKVIEENSNRDFLEVNYRKKYQCERSDPNYRQNLQNTMIKLGYHEKMIKRLSPNFLAHQLMHDFFNATTNECFYTAASFNFSKNLNDDASSK